MMDYKQWFSGRENKFFFFYIGNLDRYGLEGALDLKHKHKHVGQIMNQTEGSVNMHNSNPVA